MPVRPWTTRPLISRDGDRLGEPVTGLCSGGVFDLCFQTSSRAVACGARFQGPGVILPRGVHGVTWGNAMRAVLPVRLGGGVLAASSVGVLGSWSLAGVLLIEQVLHGFG